MKTFDMKSLTIGVLITMMIVAFMLIATSENAPRALEYRVVRSDTLSDYEAQINIAAKDGWEVVSVAAVPDPLRTNTTRPIAVMKRARADQRIAWWKFWRK